MPLFLEQFQSGRSVRFSPRGISMLPMLRQEIDSVVLSAIPDRLEKYDLPLYRRDDGKYVLHRILCIGIVKQLRQRHPIEQVGIKAVCPFNIRFFTVQ